MTFSRGCKPALMASVVWLAVGMPMPSAHAALGEHQGSIDIERMRLHAHKAVLNRPGYTIHELHTPDGSHIKQYVTMTGNVFAVVWATQYKPDLSRLLGVQHASYARAEQEQSKRGGIQRHFRLDSQQVLVQSNAHLNVYSGFAVLKPMVPTGFTLAQLSRD